MGVKLCVWIVLIRWFVVIFWFLESLIWKWFGLGSGNGKLVGWFIFWNVLDLIILVIMVGFIVVFFVIFCWVCGSLLVNKLIMCFWVLVMCVGKLLFKINVLSILGGNKVFWDFSVKWSMDFGGVSV